MTSAANSLISLSNIIILGRQGRGATSHVFLVQSTRNKQLYAMKVIDKKASKYDRHALERELSIQKGLSHANIVQLITHLQDSDNHYVLTEYCENGQITRLIMSELSEQQLALITLQVAQAIDYLHSNNIAHCDIKLSNMLIHRGRIKLCDFGYSQKIDQNSKVQNKHICGTLFYLAPEVLREKRRTFYRQADIWAIGICLLILAIKKQPYSGKSFQQIRNQILKGNHEPLSFASIEFKQFLSRLLEMDPKKRITLKELKNHPFIVKYNVNECQQLQIQKININDQISRVSDSFEIEEETEVTPNKYQKKGKSNSLRKKNATVSQQKKQEGNRMDNTLRQLSPANCLQIYKNIDAKQSIFLQSFKNKDDINSTIEKKKSIYANTDCDKTVLDNKLQKKVTLIPIEARLIHPLSEFYYQTKNQGFIRIKMTGDLQIKVKGVLFDIIKKGGILKLGDNQFCLKDLNKGITEINRQAYELYEYASQVIQIFKNKKYSHCWNQKWNNCDLVFGVTQDQKKLLCLAELETKRLLLEYSLVNKILRSRIQGQKWRIINEEYKDSDMQQLVNLIILRSCRPQ